MKPRRLIVLAAAAMLGVVAVAELFSRFALGLGDPPLTLRDAEIDYLFAPGVYRRFGNLISYNIFSMRADEVTPDPKGLLVEGRRQLDTLIDELKARVPHLVVLHHQERAETNRPPTDLAAALQQVVEGEHILYLKLQPYLDRVADDESPYRDDIHVNDLGQRLYADALVCTTMRATGQPFKGCV